MILKDYINMGGVKWIKRYNRYL